MGGSLLAQILVLLQILFVHFAYVMGGRQLTKIAYGFSLGSEDPLRFSLSDWDESSLKVFLSQLVEMIHTDSQGLPPLLTVIVSLVVQNTWQPYWTRLNITGSGSFCF